MTARPLEKTESMPPKGGLGLVFLVAGAFFMENLDATAIVSALPAMARDFAVMPADLNIGISAYMLTLGIFVAISGWASDRFGARRIFTLAILVFTLASLFCGLSQSLSQLVLARILQGIGGAMMVPVGRLLILRTTAKERLLDVIAIITWPALVAPVLGPPVGGLIVDYLGWRWIFWLNLPLGVLAFLLAWRLVPAFTATRRARFDWLGFVLVALVLVCCTLAAELLSQPDTLLGLALAVLVLGSGLLYGAVRHLRRTPWPVFDLGVLKVPTFAVGIWGGSLFRIGVSAVPFLLPLMFQLGFGFSALSSGLMLMAVFAGNLAMKSVTTPILRRFGFRRVLVVNSGINAAAIAACAIFTPDMSLWLIYAILFIGGMSRSMQFTALNTLSFADIAESDISSANTFGYTVSQLGMGMGIALGAIALRLGTGFFAADAVLPFRFAFLLVAAVAALAVVDSFRLPPDAGARLTVPAPPNGKR